MGVGISQTTVITAPTAPDPDPQPTTDPILTTGSLLLVDPTYAGSEWPAGVPAHGSTVPNAAWQKAAAVLGSGDATTLAAGIKRIDNSPTTLVLERTSKSALHGIFSQTTTTQAAAASNQIQADIVLPDALRSYLVANPSNDIYLSIWTHTTRLPTDVSNSAYAAILSNATTATHLLAVTQSATLPLGCDSARLLGRTVGTNATTRQRRSVASSAGTPTRTSTPTRRRGVTRR